MSEEALTPPNLAVGDRVRVISIPPYVKTADTMPMLRPPNVVHLQDEGILVERRPGNSWSVRFSQGTFLLDEHYIESVAAVASDSQADAGSNTGSDMSTSD